MLGQSAQLLAFMIRAGSGLFLHSRQSRLEMLGLQAAAGVLEHFADKEPLGLIVLDIVIASAAAPAVSQTHFLPAVGAIDGAAELLRVDKGFDHQHGMAIACLPIGTEPI